MLYGDCRLKNHHVDDHQCHHQRRCALYVAVADEQGWVSRKQPGGTVQNDILKNTWRRTVHRSRHARPLQLITDLNGLQCRASAWWNTISISASSAFCEAGCDAVQEVVYARRWHRLRRSGAQSGPWTVDRLHHRGCRFFQQPQQPDRKKSPKFRAPVDQAKIMPQFFPPKTKKRCCCFHCQTAGSDADSTAAFD